VQHLQIKKKSVRWEQNLPSFTEACVWVEKGYILLFGNYLVVTEWGSLRLKLQLVRDGDVVFELPLSPEDWRREMVEGEFRVVSGDFERLSRIFDALSNETRLEMMRMMLGEEDGLSFADFMRGLNLNPKIVWENSRKLIDGGLVEKTGRGQYSCSEFGEKAFVMMSMTLRRLIDSLEEIDDDANGR
jgi:DNA-binding transcriptional ArsR family regulator